MRLANTGIEKGFVDLCQKTENTSGWGGLSSLFSWAFTSFLTCCIYRLSGCHSGMFKLTAKRCFLNSDKSRTWDTWSIFAYRLEQLNKKLNWFSSRGVYIAARGNRLDPDQNETFTPDSSSFAESSGKANVKFLMRSQNCAIKNVKAEVDASLKGTLNVC